MERNEIQAKASYSIANVMGCGAFIMLDLIEPCEIPAIETWDSIGVGISCEGSHRGSMSLWASASFMRTLCANMLGAEDDSGLSTANLIDALKEMLNMIIGNVLTEVYGDEPVFDLGLPRLLTSRNLAGDQGNSFKLWYSAEGEPIMFLVDIEPPADK